MASRANRKSTNGKSAVLRQQSDNLTFNENDRKQLQEIYETVKLLKDEIQYLKSELEVSNTNLTIVKSENAQLKQALNLTNFKLDNLEQYGRRENLRLHNIPESEVNKDDGESQVIEIAKALNVKLNSSDIQRAHRLGRKKSGINPGKPRPIIVRFHAYKKRNELLHAKINLKKTEKYKNVFIYEHLTPLRSKLLRYCKQECEGKFVQCHTINGRIRFKKSAVKEGLPLDDNRKDAGTGNWITITSPDELFKVGIDVNYDKLNYEPFRYMGEMTS